MAAPSWSSSSPRAPPRASTIARSARSFRARDIQSAAAKARTPMMSASRISGTMIRRRWESIASLSAELGYIATTWQLFAGGSPHGTPIACARTETPLTWMVCGSPTRSPSTGPARFPDETSCPPDTSPSCWIGVHHAALLEIRDQILVERTRDDHPATGAPVDLHRRRQERRLRWPATDLLLVLVERDRQTGAGGRSALEPGDRSGARRASAPAARRERPAIVVAAVVASAAWVRYAWPPAAAAVASPLSTLDTLFCSRRRSTSTPAATSGTSASPISTMESL